MVYIVMAFEVMAQIVVAHAFATFVAAYILMVYIVMAFRVMAKMVMAHVFATFVAACIVMVYTVVAFVAVAFVVTAEVVVARYFLRRLSPRCQRHAAPPPTCPSTAIVQAAAGDARGSTGDAAATSPA